MSYRVDLLREFDKDFGRGSDAVLKEYRLAVQTDPATPLDTGRLMDGLVYKNRVLRPGFVSAELTSTARSDEGADYPTILDLSTGRRVEAKNYGHRAFGPFKKPWNGTRFLSSFRVTTKHVGWWDKVNNAGNWADAVRLLDRFRL